MLPRLDEGLDIDGLVQHTFHIYDNIAGGILADTNGDGGPAGVAADGDFPLLSEVNFSPIFFCTFLNPSFISYLVNSRQESVLDCWASSDSGAEYIQ